MNKKKKIIASLSALALVAGISTQAFAAGTVSQTTAQSTALNHAGIAQADTSWLNTQLDYDDGRQIYEVEFRSGSTEYDYDIDASNGTILSFSSELEYYGQTDGTTGTAVSEADAKKTALARVSGATDSNIRIRSDYDDGRTVYEGTIVYGEMKYEFEINASTGAIIEWDMESVYDD